MARKSERAPVYLSARAADVILSEIRPTRLKPDALQSINALLDELLHLILKTSKSLSPPKLKDGLLKLLQTPLGKEAVLEAELELRNHSERGAVSAISSDDGTALDNASVEVAFELLRSKCEISTTLNEVDEGPDLDKYTLSIGDGSKFKKATVNAAVYYLTAILEHICQHVLSNVGRVVTRDSSRTLATAHDLYIGLCEDDTIYPLVSSMSAFGTISAQSSVLAPRKGRTSTSHQDHGSVGTSRTSSPIPQQQADGRTSRTSESHAPSRSSLEKNRALRMFRSGSVSDNGHGGEPFPTPALPHKRSQSQHSSFRKHSTSVEDDGRVGEETNQEFDELMRSGETMKVSLTPDRLQTMETYKQKVSQLMTTGKSQRDEPQSPLSHTRKMSVRPFGSSKRVDAIEEDEEDAPGPAEKVDNTRANASIHISQDSEARKAAWVIPPARILSKPSTTSDPSEALGALQPSIPPIETSPVLSKINRSNGRARNRTSLDLDDIMNGLDGGGRSYQDSALLPKTATTSSKSDTRDLIDFLDSGPPPQDFHPSASVGSPNGIASESVRKGGSRFRSMVSRLRPRASSDFNKVDETGLLKPGLRTKNSSPDVTQTPGLTPYPRPPRISPTSPSSYHDPTKEASITRSSTIRKPVPNIDAARSADPSSVQVGKPPMTATLVDSGSTPSTESVAATASPKPARPGRSAAREGMVNGHASSPIETANARLLHENKRTANGHHAAERSGVSKQFADQLMNVLGKAETAEECRLVVQALLRQAGHTYAAQVQDASPVTMNESESWPLIEMFLDS